MPVMDGFEAVAAIRRGEGPSAGRVPVIALTAHALKGDRQRCLDAGFDDYLSKPVKATRLRESLARFGAGSREPPPSGAEPPIGEPAFDRSAALEALGGDEPLLAEVLGLFFDDWPRLAAEIRAAFDDRDAAALKRLGHSAAGAAGNFGASAVVASARRLEAMGRAGELAEADDACTELDRAVERFREAAGHAPAMADREA